MKSPRLILSVLVIMMLGGAAHAEPIKLTIAQLSQVFEGLRELSAGYQKIVHDGARESVVNQPYELGGGLVLDIYRDITRIDAKLAPVREATKAVMTRFGPVDPGSPKAQERDAAVQSLVDAASAEDVDLARIRLSELKVGAPNPISPTTLAKLEPILVEEAPKK